jgi:nucleoside-diphosphate-sugar epimerase
MQDMNIEPARNAGTTGAVVKSRKVKKVLGRLNLVTGACGFTGSVLAKRLLDAGQKVVVTDLPGAFEHPKVRFIFRMKGIDFSHPNCTVIPSDLTEPKSLKALFDRPVTHVFHTASLYDYSARMEILKKINIGGFDNLMEALRGGGEVRRFIHWSTCGVFGKPHAASEGGACNIPFNEDFCPSPKNTPFEKDGPAGTNLVNDYSITKFKQEQMAWKRHREDGLPLTVLRPAPVYGPGSDYGHGGIIISINKGLLPVIPADAANYITTSVHVDDVAGFALFIADRGVGLGEDYNVVDDSIISYAEHLHYTALLLGRRIREIPFIRQKHLQPLMIAAARLWLWLEREYGMKRVRVLEVGSATYVASSYWLSNAKSKGTGYVYRYPDAKEGLRDTVDWFRRAGWLDKNYDPQATWKEYAISSHKARRSCTKSRR